MARNERSAGVILFRQSAPDAPREYLLLDYGKHWDYAKGHVENGEDDRAAAVRELEEETGITDVTFVEGFAHTIEYFFRSKRHGLVRKQVVFFAGRTNATEIRLSHEHMGYVFLPYEHALKKLTYASARKVMELLETHVGTQG